MLDGCSHGPYTRRVRSTKITFMVQPAWQSLDGVGAGQATGYPSVSVMSDLVRRRHVLTPIIRSGCGQK